MFDVPFEAQILRVNPQTWINGIALRVEIIGCRENLPTISPTVCGNFVFRKNDFTKSWTDCKFLHIDDYFAK